MYRDWSAELPDWTEVCGVVFPGRGPRVQETPLTRMDQLADTLAEALARDDGPPTVLFGHSLGALIAFEVADRLRGRPDRVAALAVAAHRAPGLGHAGGEHHLPPDDELLGILADLGATPPEALAHPHIRRMALSALRADFQLGGTYRYRERPPLSVPLCVFGGLDDPLLPPGELDAWRDRTSGECSVRIVAGGHFFPFFPRGPGGAEMFAGLRELLAGKTVPARPHDPDHSTRSVSDVRGR
jgi:surfactin synthase thioesterase subunit